MQLNTIDGIKTLPALQLDFRLDPTVSIDRETIAFEQGYTFNYHSILSNTQDYTFNKYSNFYLSDNYNVSDVVTLQPLVSEFPETISTFLMFNRLDFDPLSGLTGLSGDTCLTAASAVSALTAEDVTSDYLTILTDTTGVSTASDATTRTCKLSAETFTNAKLKDTLEQNFYFNITFLDGIDCVVYHYTQDTRYFLSHRTEGDAELQFEVGDLDLGLEHNVTEIREIFADNRHIFKYTYYRELNLIRLYKEWQGTMRVVELITDSDRAKPAFQGIPPVRLTDIQDEYSISDPGSDLDDTTNYPNPLELTDRTVLRLRPQSNSLQGNRIDSKIHNFEKSVDLSNINVGESTNVSNNILLHSEYYYLTGNSIPVNFFPVMNQLNANGNVSHSNMYTDMESYKQRDYNKLFTGTNQLQGSDNIYLDYTAYEHEYTFKPGMNYFNTPQDMGVVSRLNINDSTLPTCGACSSDNPSRADKIYKKLSNYNNTTRGGNPSGTQSGTWLCTWLSGSDDPDTQPVWMDRYYNPSTTGYIQALTYDETTIISTYKDKQLDDISNLQTDIYDTRSTLTLEPGCSYAYYRVSRTDFTKNLTRFDPNVIQSGFSNYKTLTNQLLPTTGNDQEYKFDNNRFATTNIDKRNNYQQLSINFNMQIDDWQNPVGHQLLGNYHDDGIGIFNRNDVSPFIYVISTDGQAVTVDNNLTTNNTSVRIYDKNFKIYNYITNNSFLRDTDTPGIFEKVVVRELPENLYFVMSTGTIVESTHDGVILATYEDWNNYYADDSTATIASTTYDNQFIYILTHTTKNIHGYSVDKFDMLNKKFTTGINDCIIKVPTPVEYNDNTNYEFGRQINYGTLPTFIHVKNDLPPYQHQRNIFIGTGDKVRAASKYLHIYVEGEIDSATSRKVKHDSIYTFDIKTLELVPGKIYDTNVEDDTESLDILDFVVDSRDNIWIVHSGNVITKLNNNRNILKTTILEEQQCVSLCIVNDFITPKSIDNRVVILTKTVGGEEIGIQIGPTQHPTAILNGRAYRKASGWYDNGTFYGRPETTSAIVNYDTDDESIPFDDTKHLIYPFVEGDSRFGLHTQDIDTIISTDSTGVVINDDYSVITETFDYLVTEVADTASAIIIDPVTDNVSDTIQITNLPLDIFVPPAMISPHTYNKENYNNYEKHNLNLKLQLKSLYDSVESDMVVMSVDLSKLNKNNPYTGEHNVNINIDNTKGVVELYIDGNIIDPSHTYNFTPNKYTFINILDRDMLVGASSYLDNIPTGDKIKQPTLYTAAGFTVSNFVMRDACMSYHDIISIISEKHEPGELHFGIPISTRNYIDTIERVFNHSVPPRKSNAFNINIRNSRITSERLQRYLGNKVKLLTDNITPAGTQLLNIKWFNELLS